MFTYVSYFSDSLADIDKKVVIVSIFGKSQYQAKGWKTEMLNSVLQTNLLEDTKIDDETLVNLPQFLSNE